MPYANAVCVERSRLQVNEPAHSCRTTIRGQQIPPLALIGCVYNASSNRRCKPLQLRFMPICARTRARRSAEPRLAGFPTAVPCTVPTLRPPAEQWARCQKVLVGDSSASSCYLVVRLVARPSRVDWIRRSRLLCVPHCGGGSLPVVQTLAVGYQSAHTRAEACLRGCLGAQSTRVRRCGSPSTSTKPHLHRRSSCVWRPCHVCYARSRGSCHAYGSVGVWGYATDRVRRRGAAPRARCACAAQREVPRARALSRHEEKPDGHMQAWIHAPVACATSPGSERSGVWASGDGKVGEAREEPLRIGKRVGAVASPGSSARSVLPS